MMPPPLHRPRPSQTMRPSSPGATCLNTGAKPERQSSEALSSVTLRCRLMFILGVVTLGSSSLTLMEPTLPLYLQTTYKVQLRRRR